MLVDAEPELLHAATAHVRAVGGDRLDVRAVQADATDDALLDLAPRAVGELLDEYGPHYVGRRDDVFVLAAHTVHLGTAPG